MARTSDVSMSEGTWAANTPILTRTGTTILDMLNFAILFIVSFFATAIFAGMLEGAGVVSKHDGPFAGEELPTPVVISFFVFALLLWLGQTAIYAERSITPSPAKKRRGVVVVREPYIAYNALVIPHIQRLVARECLRALSFLSVVGIFVPIFHRNNRALHDMLTGTRSMKIMATGRDGVELVHERRLSDAIRNAVREGKPLPDVEGDRDSGTRPAPAGNTPKDGSDSPDTGPPVREPMDKPLEALHALTGLENVKTEITELAATAQTDRERARHGFAVPATTHHMVFTGNPGTGKTTVARIVGGIFKQTGILKRGHVVEADSTQLIGKYTGHTAPQTQACIDAAIDGVLLIDEAYRLTETRAAEQYGREAISTLLTEMENHRDRLVVIVAGYPANMESFLSANPGLKSRFARNIHFPDYDPDALHTIFCAMARETDFTLDEAASEAAYARLSALYEERDADFGNARTVRNLFEAARRRQALRLQFREGKPRRADLQHMAADDIIEARLKG